MTQTILLLDHDADVRNAALLCLASPSWLVVAASGEDDPDTLARRYPADLLVLGSVDPPNVDRISSLRQAFRKPVIPLFRPSVYSRRQASPADLGPDLMLGLLDCRTRIGQHPESCALPPEASMRWGGFTMTLAPSAFAFNGNALDLTKVQAAMLTLLMLHGGEVVSRRMIEEVVFSGKPVSDTNLISVHISRLRSKLRDNQSDVSIENVKGCGYALFWNRSLSTEPVPKPEIGFIGLPGRTHADAVALKRADVYAPPTGVAPPGSRARQAARAIRRRVL